MNTSTVTSNAEAEPKVGIFWDYEVGYRHFFEFKSWGY